MGQGTYTGLADARRRGARRRLVADPRRRRAGRRQALQQPLLGSGAGHRRQHGDRQLVRAAAQGRRDRARDARRRRRASVERARGRDRGWQRGSSRTPSGQARAVRRARRRRGEAAGAGGGEAEGPASASSTSARHAARTDARAKSTGQALFTQDVRLPGHADRGGAHPPRFGAKLKSFDAARAKAVKGVVDVVAFSTPVTNGVAVLATDFWSASKGRDALAVEWDESAAFKLELGRHHGRVPEARRAAGHRGAQATATSRARSPAPRGRSRPRTNSPTSRMPRWSR